MLTPVKQIKQRDKAFNDIFSSAVSKVRQSIEVFFNWLNEKQLFKELQK